MSEADEAELVAVHLRSQAAAVAVREAWDAGAAVAMLDPRAPPAAVDSVLRSVRPTWLVDADGRRLLDGGARVPAGTAAVVLTSGTTAAPKAVELTSAGRDAIGGGFGTALATTAADHWLVCLPLHHVAGLAILGRAVTTRLPVTVHERFDVDAVAASPARDGTTIVSLVPTMLLRLLDARAPLRHYRHVIVGGAPLAASLRARAEDAGVPVLDTYGLTETWGGIILNGVPIPGAEVMLAEDNELLVRGAMVMGRYRFDPAATAAAFTDDGWLRTGDVGTHDARGRFRVIDRCRELIVTGGVNVSPSAVESVLARHPDVGDVCVAGRPDREWGERVVAFVVARNATAPPSLDALRDFARDDLPPAALPREVVLSDELPRTPGGKPLRRLLHR